MVPFRRAYIQRRIRINAVRRGLLGGSRFWTAVFVAGRLRGFVQRVTKRAEMPIVSSDEVGVGEGLVIRHLRPGED